ncbi:hypothetical protein BH09PSE4_BH09PSE4_07470 [soil metagenome]
MATRLKQVLGGREAQPVKGVTGNGSVEAMVLFYYRPSIQNSFRTQLIATMAEEGTGTRIEGTIGTPLTARLFMGCWFSFLTLFIGIIVTGVAISHAAPLMEMAPLILIPGAMMGFGALMWIAGTWNAKKDAAAILAFLAETVSAIPA